MAPQDTIRRISPYMRGIGVTRIADTTGLDTLGMHIFSAIRPTDADLDGISVYNGKGLTKADSRAGAMMEAIERYRAESWLGEIYHGTYQDMCHQHPEARVMDPATMRLQRRKPYDPELSLNWVDGWDLLNDAPAIVAMNFVLCPYRGPGRGIWMSSTNGLASGNCIEEAVCHALAELIERDAYTIAMVRTELSARFERLVEQVMTSQELPLRADAEPLYRCVDLTTLPPKVRNLVRLAERADTGVLLRNVTSDLGIPTFLAFLFSSDGNGEEFSAAGFGCDPNATIAAIRAITEAAQGRNVSIQGVREDARAVKPLPPDSDWVLWRKDDEYSMPFQAVATTENDDILADVDLMVGTLRSAGIKDAYAVDLSDPGIPASVARVIVPELESWFLNDFSPESCRLGWRAGRYLESGANEKAAG
jgi:ribosomal protein S12 methylthiotransferase accessory factor